MRILLIHSILLAILIIGNSPVSGAGDISFGVYLGLTQDMNNLENEINAYNIAMEQYKTANNGTEVTQLNSPYAITTGMSIDYTFNIFMLKTGVYFSQAYVYPTMGSITPAAGSRNTIKFTSYQLLVPFSFGITIPLGKRTFLYWGVGISLVHTSLEITQSAPNAAYALPDSNSKDAYSDTFSAFHFIVGAEIPLSESISLPGVWGLMCT